MGMELSSAETERQVGGDGIETCGMGGVGSGGCGLSPVHSLL